MKRGKREEKERPTFSEDAAGAVCPFPAVPICQIGWNQRLKRLELGMVVRIVALICPAVIGPGIKHFKTFKQIFQCHGSPI